MKSFIIPCLGSSPIIPSGIYSHVNDRYITRGILNGIQNKVNIGHQNKLCTDTPIADIIGILSGYECISDANGAGGYCDFNNKTIAISSKQRWLLSTVCHEICHSIQAEHGMFNDFGALLSDQVKIEHQCETMAYYLYNGLFPEAPIPWYKFTAYFDKNSIIWLADWYKGYVENDFIFKS